MRKPDREVATKHYRALVWSNLDGMQHHLTPESAIEALEELYDPEWMLATVALPPHGFILVYEKCR